MTSAVYRALPARLHRLLIGLCWIGSLTLCSSGAAQANSAVVDLRSHDGDAPYFVSFVALASNTATLQPSALVVWGDPHVAAAGDAYESVGLVTTGSSAMLSTEGTDGASTTRMYFGRLPDAIVSQLHFERLMSGAGSRTIADSLTVMVDESAYRDAYEVFGGPRGGTYFADQAILAGDTGAYHHGIGQIISYFAGIGSHLGEAVPDSLHLASTAAEDPTGLPATFSPQLYLRSMIATAVANRTIVAEGGWWSGDTFGLWPNGRGQFWYLSGACYSGEVHRGQRRGRGSWLGMDGLMIDGQFDGDQPIEATVNFPNGDAFSGSLRDYRLRYGSYRWRDGTRYTGSFGLSEQLVDGLLTEADGTEVPVHKGRVQANGITPVPATLPRVSRLLAYAMDLSR